MEGDPPTPDTSDAKPGDIISALQALQIKSAKNKDMQKILSDVLGKKELTQWESLLAAAPNALYAIGQCFIVALPGDVGQIKQTRDGSMYATLAILLALCAAKLIASHDSSPADLRANLVHCSDLGLDTFAEAEDKMANLTTTITAIIEHRGIMDKILNAVDDIRSALQSGSGEDIQASRGDLEEQLADLKKRAQGCTEDSASVVKKFTKWHLEVNKINLAYTEAHGEETTNRNKLKKERRDLLAQVKKIEDGSDESGFLEKMRATIDRWIKKDKDAGAGVLRSRIGRLDTQNLNRETVLKVLESFLDTLKQIKESLELLNRFFKGIHRQINDLSQNRLPPFVRDISKESWTKRKLDDIQYDAHKIRCQYLHAEKKASIYVEASQKYIIPGVKLIHSLNSGSDVSAKDMEEKLFQYYEDSLKGICVFAEQLPTHAELMKQIQDGLSSEE